VYTLDGPFKFSIDRKVQSAEEMPMSTSVSVTHSISTEAPIAYAGFWRRVAAFLIDCAAMFLPLIFLTFIVVVIIRLVSAGRGHDPAVGMILIWPVVTFFAACVYFSALEASPLQATLGKAVVGLRVCDLTGHRITVLRAFGRNIAKCLSTLSVGIGFLICGVTKKKQALHDMLAGCVVLRRP
jgi:uncharacterized RDD family membrane protein YckC